MGGTPDSDVGSSLHQSELTQIGVSVVVIHDSSLNKGMLSLAEIREEVAIKDAPGIVAIGSKAILSGSPRTLTKPGKKAKGRSWRRPSQGRYCERKDQTRKGRSH